jgi:type I pantothenate kinase
VVAVTGGVAVGKSTTARALAVLLRQWHQHPKVELVSVDSFIKSQETLNAQGLAHKKGFLESFDFDFLLNFLIKLKSRDLPLTLPLYSHRLYDRVKNDSQLIKAPDVVVIEGLHLLNPYPLDTQGLHVLSDYVDFSVYVDADVTYIKRWFFERFLHLREQARDDEEAFFHQFAIMEQEQALQIANDVWENMNAPNYWQNIHPYRERADLILSKNVHHEVDKVWLRK